MSFDLHPSSIRNFAILIFCLFLEEQVNNFVETHFARGTCVERTAGYKKELALYMLWFNFILGLNLIFLCFKFKPRMKLNHNVYIYIS